MCGGPGPDGQVMPPYRIARPRPGVKVGHQKRRGEIMVFALRREVDMADIAGSLQGLKSVPIELALPWRRQDYEDTKERLPEVEDYAEARRPDRGRSSRHPGFAHPGRFFVLGNPYPGDGPDTRPRLCRLSSQPGGQNEAERYATLCPAAVERAQEGRT